MRCIAQRTRQKCISLLRSARVNKRRRRNFNRYTTPIIGSSRTRKGRRTTCDDYHKRFTVPDLPPSIHFIRLCDLEAQKPQTTFVNNRRTIQKGTRGRQTNIRNLSWACRDFRSVAPLSIPPYTHPYHQRMNGGGVTIDVVWNKKTSIEDRRKEEKHSKGIRTQLADKARVSKRWDRQHHVRHVPRIGSFFLVKCRGLGETPQTDRYANHRGPVPLVWRELKFFVLG